MNLVLWVLGLPVGLAFLFVVFRAARLDEKRARGERGPLWLLALAVGLFALGVIILMR